MEIAIRKQYKTIIIGIDESYTRTGLSIAVDGELIKVGSLSFKGLKSKSQKRKALSLILSKVIPQCLLKAKSVAIIVERIRTFSGGGKGGQSMLSIPYIKATGALIGSIVDVAEEYGIRVYSVDTRSWKSKIVGTSKPKNGDNKLPTIEYVCTLGFKEAITLKPNRKGIIKMNDDAADSACIALYGFLPKSQRCLKREE